MKFFVVLAIVSIDYNNIVLTEIIGNTAKLGGAKNRERGCKLLSQII